MDTFGYARIRNTFIFLGLGLSLIGLTGLIDFNSSPEITPTEVQMAFSPEELEGGLLLSEPPTSISPQQSPTPDGTNYPSVYKLMIATNTPLIPPGTPLRYAYSERGEPLLITWGDYPAPAIWPGTAVPPPMGMLPKPEGQINILLFGNDYTRNSGARTDAIMLLTLNPETGTASVTSFPRDLWVYAPGWSLMKLNTTQGRGGFELTALTFEYNFGIRPDYYVNVSLSNFGIFIDAIGGIDVYVHKPLSDPTYANGKYHIPEGMVHMDGAITRFYVRSRRSTSDLDRNIRQQEVLKAVFLKLMSVDAVGNIPELYSLYKSSFYSNMSLTDVLSLAPLALELTDTSRISRHAINYNHASAYTTPREKAWVLIPNYNKIRQLLLLALAP